MITLEEYIMKRKKEDGIQEYDLTKRTENIRICVNYVFEYFINYLDTVPTDEKTILHDGKIINYRKIIELYDESIREWLVSLYSSYGKYMHQNLSNYIDDIYFLLYDSDSEFRALSYQIYSKAIKKYHFLNGHSEEIFLFLKDYHRVKSLFHPNENFYICENINEWVNETYKENGINLLHFCKDWIIEINRNFDIWPTNHRKKSTDYDFYSKTSPMRDLYDYDYKQKSNLFNLDKLYRDMPKKSFTKGKKQEFEILLLYYYLHSIERDDDYWNTYLGIVLTKMQESQ